MLLTEDGLVRSRRGVGRLVSTSLPATGLEQIVPAELLLAVSGSPARLQRSQSARQPASEFTAPNLGIRPGEDTIFWESVIHRGSEPIAQIQETLAANAVADLDSERHPNQSMLASLIDQLGPTLGPGNCEVGVSICGPTRASVLEVAETDPVLVLTQAVQRSGRPFYHAKYVVAARAGHLSIAQSHLG